MTPSFLTAVALCVPVLAVAQQPAIRQLGPVVATSTETLGTLVFVRHLPTSALVNDVQNRRLLLFDATLSKFTVVADTTAATANAYSGRVASLIAFRGDSSLFVDGQSMSMLVIDPAGQVKRVMSIPRSQDAMTLGSAVFGQAGFDASGRLVYRAAPRFQMRMGPGGPGMSEQPDTTAILRVDLATRQVDTVGFIKTARPKVDISRDESGRPNISMQWNPLPVIDDWAVLSDGSVAFVRGRDYHLDWVRPDGSRSSSPKIPFEWQRLTDEDKVAFIDSLKAARERMAASQPQPAPGSSTTTTQGPGGATETRTIVMAGPPGGALGAMGAGGIPGGPNANFVPASELPDYKPPFFAGATRADADGNLWIRTIPTKAIAGGIVYDVINGKGELVERVQVPKDRTIVGFGPGGIVYLLARDSGSTSAKLEKARVR